MRDARYISHSNYKTNTRLFIGLPSNLATVVRQSLLYTVLTASTETGFSDILH